MRNEILIHWRNTQPQAASFPANVAAILDTASEFAAENQGSFFWFRHDDCDIFDVVRLAEWLKESGLMSTVTEKFQLEVALTWLRDNQTPFMSAAEVELRMKHSDGDCPLCGSNISFHREPDDQGRYSVLGHCGHFAYTHVHDTDRALRHIKSWSGHRWPIERFSSAMLARPDGQPIQHREERGFSHHCSGCMAADARRQFRAELIDMLEGFVRQDKPEWRGLGSSPVSELHGLRCPGHTDDVRHFRIAQMADKIVSDDHTEFRLNGAGLKLYGHPVHVDYNRRLTFSVNIHGDQARDYPAFMAHAQAELERRGLRDVKYPQAA